MIGNRIKKLLKQQNLKQATLAEAIGISPSRLSNYISNKREPDFDMLMKIAKFLHVDMNYFFNETSTSRVIEASISEFDSNISEDTSDSITNIPLKKLNARKWAEPSSSIKLDTKLIPADVSEVSAIEVTTSMGNIPISKGDYLIVSSMSGYKLKHGDIICVTGRNYKMYRVLMYQNEVFVTDFKAKCLQKLSDLRNSDVYVVLLIMVRYF